MKSSADHVIDGDLAALGESSRRSIAAVDAALNTTGVYRDDRPGAEARRDSLADVRRRELALMPLTLSHLFAHRIARAAAGGAATLAAIGLFGALTDDRIVRNLAPWFPGIAIVMFVVLAVAFVLAAYVVATWVAERSFARSMREQVAKSSDVYSDLDQLAVGPFAVAAEKVRRLDYLSTALPLVGIATLVPLVGYVLFVSVLAFEMPHYFGSTIDMFLAMTSDIQFVLVALVAGLAFAIFVGRACRREHRYTIASDTTRLFGHWSMLLVAGFIGLVVLVGAARIGFGLQSGYRGTPSDNTRLLLSVGGEIAILLPATWGILWWRRRERTKLGD